MSSGPFYRLYHSTRGDCDICGWRCVGRHYEAKGGDIKHCAVCHPVGKDWARDGDSERLELGER